MTEIINFPPSKIVRPIPSEFEEQMRLKGKKQFLESTTNEISQILFDYIAEYGIDTDSDAFIKDFAFTVDVIRAMISRTLELEHPILKLIDETPTVKTQKEKDALLNQLPCDVEPSVEEANS